MNREMIMSSNTNVRVELQYTKNLGNYESMRVSIGIEDFRRDGETIDEATERVYKFVEDKLEQKMLDIAEDLKNG
jgi:ASC-1-like (ASCH) protein